MRVAILTHNAQFGDAIGNQIAEKVAFFLDSGADVRVFAESGRRLHPDVASHCRRLDDTPEGEGWRFLEGADLIIVEYGQSYRLLNLLPLLAGGKARILFDYHGVTPPQALDGKNAWPAGHLEERGFAWCADGVLVHSRSAGADLLEATGYPRDRAFELGYPIDTGFWRPGKAETDLRGQLDIGQAPMLLFVGRLAGNKRVPLAVETLPRLQAADAHLVVIGDDSDRYELEAERCRALAGRLGVAERVHLLGQAPTYRLRDAYRSADVFVMPSIHEGFCLPVLEAMACGLPVVAARATALPETVGGAGLTFRAEDADDLAARIDRVLASEPSALRLRSDSRVAVVMGRFGTDFVGGAETSLRTIAEILHEAGRGVEIFTTTAIDEAGRESRYAEGTSTHAGMPVHRFRPERGEGPLRVPALIAALQARADEFDAIVVGPYLLGLTLDIARAFPERTVLVPCFHDEPKARQAERIEVFNNVAGIWYHTPEEQQLAEADLGINHPGAACIGTHIDAANAGDAERGRKRVGGARPYVVYCGRYIEEKGVVALLEAARAYAERNADRFTFVFMGAGNVPIPREPWAVDLGFVSDEVKRDVLAGAAALIQLSPNESLSLTTLEAWAQGTPVIASRQCAVLAAQLARAEGGRAVADAGELAEALDDLWQNPDHWRQLGLNGQAYTQAVYGSRERLGDALKLALADLQRPLPIRMRERGFLRAGRFDRDEWRLGFSEVVEQVLDLPARMKQMQLDVEPRGSTRSASPGQESVLVPVRLTNRGTQPLLAEGPARVVLRSEVIDDDGRVLGSLETPLPGLLAPNGVQALAVPVPVPARRGEYRAVFHALFPEDRYPSQSAFAAPAAALELRVGLDEASGGPAAPLLATVQRLLADAQSLQRLPDDYVDVSEGFLAGLKRWLKKKLLGNFKTAYVDALSRQQSQFNRQLMTALAELAECCAILDHAGKMKQEKAGPPDAGPSKPVAAPPARKKESA